MSATDELRAMLDERGVEWKARSEYVTFWSGGPFRWCAVEGDTAQGNRVFLVGMASCAVECMVSMTPAQAIEATLGRGNAGRYVGLRQGKYWERTENSDYYCGGCGWKVTDHDSYCPECGGALHKATLGRGELERENAELRELVKDIDEVADSFLWEFIGRRMRELGIEVEEC